MTAAPSGDAAPKRPQPKRPNPLRGRVARGGDTPASMGNLANIITVVRILLTPVFLWLLFADGGEHGLMRVIAAAMFILLIATDSVDGMLARRQNLVTDFGKLVDPIADKGLVLSALVSLSILGELPWWVTIVILVRELGITAMRFALLRDRVIPAGLLGKIKTVVQAVAIAFALTPLWVWLGEWIHLVNTGLMTLALVLTVASGVQYVVQAVRVGRAPR